LWLGTAAVGCTLNDKSDPTFEEIVAEHEEGLDAELTDCGTGVLPSACAEELSAAEACLVDAAGACQPAKMRQELTTDEGDPIVTVVYVDSDCGITQFTDNHADAFKGDYGDFERTDCTGASEQPHDHATGACATIVWEDCETTQEWFVGD
jgi:hypothetical protein